MNVSLLSYDALMNQLSNNQAEIAEFSTLEKIVRQGHQPDSPKLLKRYLDIGCNYAVHKPTSLQIKIFNSILDTLLDTVCDHCIALQWRQLCLNNCYRPLSTLETLITNDQEKHLLKQQYYKLRTLSHYFH